MWFLILLCPVSHFSVTGILLKNIFLFRFLAFLMFIHFLGNPNAKWISAKKKKMREKKERQRLIPNSNGFPSSNMYLRRRFSHSLLLILVGSWISWYLLIFNFSFLYFSGTRLCIMSRDHGSRILINLHSTHLPCCWLLTTMIGSYRYIHWSYWRLVSLWS